MQGWCLSLPWNRRLRKRFESCQSGDPFDFVPRAGVLEEAPGQLEEVCALLGFAGQDLLSDSVISCLAELCESGKVDAVVGGPPCRTVSKLRFRRPGPPPLRARTGAGRFGLTGLTDGQREVLWFGLLWLFTLAQSGGAQWEGDVLEGEAADDPNVYPSFYA